MKSAIQRNKWFNGLSKKEKAIAIARDVLARVSTRKIKPRSGTWARFSNRRGPETSAQKLLDKGVPCYACALGAAACGLIGYTNKADVNPYGQIKIVADFPKQTELKRIFGKDAILMEMAFESGNGLYSSYEIGTDDSDRAKAYREAHNLKTDRAALISIFKNIIKNKGRFIP